MNTQETFFLSLKSLRESKNIEVDEIAEYTKINPKYLHAIEAGEFKLLPKVYMRLFLRSYAQFIGADDNQALDDYELHTTGKVPIRSQSNMKKKSETINQEKNETIINSEPIPPIRIITGIAVIVGIVIFFKLISGLSKDQNNINNLYEHQIESKQINNLETNNIQKNKTNEIEQKENKDSIIETTITDSLQKKN